MRDYSITHTHHLISPASPENFDYIHRVPFDHHMNYFFLVARYPKYPTMMVARAPIKATITFVSILPSGI